MAARVPRPSRTGRRARALVAIAGVAIAGLAALGALACGAPDARRLAVVVGAPAPAYEAVAQDGAPVSLAAQRGQVVLLNVWATWCKPCREEIPALQSLFERYGARGFTVAGVSIDVDGDRGAVAEFARGLGARYPLWYDPDDRVSTTFLAIGVPSSYLVDREGTLVWKHLGPVKADDAALLAALETALGAGAGAATASEDRPPAVRGP